jgi:hypothetical protein
MILAELLKEAWIVELDYIIGMEKKRNWECLQKLV